jgi:opacity protein-like surface antigen
MKSFLLGSLGLLFASTAFLHAQHVELTPYFGYRFGGEVQDVAEGTTYNFKDTAAYGLVLALSPSRVEEGTTRVEALWSRQDSSIDLHGNYGLNKVNLTIDEYQLGGRVEKGEDFHREYLSLHAGVTNFAADGFGSDTKFSFGFGGGVMIYITSRIALRGDVRAFCTVLSSDSGVIYYNNVAVVTYSGSTLWQGQASLGLSFSF